MPRDVMDFDARKKPAWIEPADDYLPSRSLASRRTGTRECSKRG